MSRRSTEPAPAGGAVATSQPSRTRTIAGIVAATASAAMLILIWPALGNLWWLVGVALVPMYVAQYRLLSRRLAPLAVAVALGGYGFGLMMVAASVMPWYAVAAGTLMTFGLGWLLGLGQRGFSERTSYRWFIVQLPILWVFLDVVSRENEWFGTYSWLAYRLEYVPALIQPVSLVGTPALSLLILMVNATVALLIIAALDRIDSSTGGSQVPVGVAAWSAALTVVLCASWAASSMSIYHDTTAVQGPTVRTAFVQPSLANATPGTLMAAQGSSRERSDDQRNDEQAAQLAELTEQAAAQGAQLVVWPEEFLTYDPREVRTAWIPELLRRTGVYLVMGFTVDFKDPSQPNRALLWSPQGEVLGVYHKTKRVLAEGESFEPGSAYPAFATSLGPIGMVICFDLDFPDGPVRRTVLSGAQIVAAPSIDFASVAALRTGATVFRAVENRVGIVKADVAWDSAIIAPNGDVLDDVTYTNSSGGAAVHVADLPRGPLNAPFSLYGVTPFQWLISVAAVLLIVTMTVTWWRERRDDRRS